MPPPENARPAASVIGESLAPLAFPFASRMVRISLASALLIRAVVSSSINLFSGIPNTIGGCSSSSGSPAAHTPTVSGANGRSAVFNSMLRAAKAASTLWASSCSSSP